MHECSYISLRENASKDAILLVASFDQAYAERSVDKDVEHRDAEGVWIYFSHIDIFPLRCFAILNVFHYLLKILFFHRIF